MRDKTYRFRIEGHTPETLPMKRFADYLAMLARLFGHEKNVHLAQINFGSIETVAQIDGPARNAVAKRLLSVGAGTAEPDAMKAYTEIDKELAKDDAVGRIVTRKGHNIINFPGKNREHTAEYAQVAQPATLQGVLVSLSGSDDTKHAQLVDGDIKHTGLETKNLELLKRMSRHLWGAPIRVIGQGHFTRNADGVWELKYFRMDDFEELENLSFKDTVARLRSVPNGVRVDDALLRELQTERSED